MAMLNGVVESKARAGNSIKVNGDWYGSFKGKGLEDIQPGHYVSSSWDYDKTGKYRNIKTVSVVGGSITAVAGTAGTPTNWKPQNNLGVELGHASKLAMDLVLKKFAPTDIGGDEFYKEFLFHTDKIYKIMGKLRETKAAAAAESAAPATAVAAKPKEPILEEEGEDLF